MKEPVPTFVRRCASALFALTMLGLPFSARAATNYWDNNDATAGFGTAAGTWAAPTTNDATQGWSTSSAGTATLTGTTTTTTNDTLYFGTDADGLVAGTIAVSGTVGAGHLYFGSDSEAIALSGGTITLGGASRSITVNNASDTIGSVIAGSSGLVKLGGGTLNLTGSNNYTGATTLSNGTLALGNANALAGGGIIVFKGGTLQYSASNTVDYSTRITNSTSAVKIDTAGQNVTWSTALSSAQANGGLTKVGAGTLQMTKSLGVNSATMFAGALTVDGGHLRIVTPASATTGNTNLIEFNSLVSINNGSTLQFTNLGGEGRTKFAGGLTFGASGGNTLALDGTSAANNLVQGNYTFTTLGGTTNFITRAGSAFISMQNGAGRFLTFNVADGSGDIDLVVTVPVVDGAITKTGAGVLSLQGNNTGLTNVVISNGTLELAGAGRLVSGNYANLITNNGTFAYSGTNNQTLSGVISGTGHLTKSGDATLTLSAANTYSGTTAVNGGRLHAGANSTFSSNSALVVGGGGVVSLVGFTNEVGSLAGAGLVDNSSAGSGRLTAGGNNTSTTFSGTLQDGSGGGTLSLVKTGTGTMTLSGNNSYSGATTVSAGTLVVDGTNSASATTVQSGATLAGSGSLYSATIEDGGTISPGNSPGTFTLTNGLTWNAGGNYNWQIYDAAGTAGDPNGWDLIAVTGGTWDITGLSSGNPFEINLWSLSGISPDANGDAINFDNTQNYTWEILTYSSLNGTFSTDLFNINVAANNGTGGYANALGGGVFSLAVDGDSLNLLFTAAGAAPVPEPGTWAVAALLAGAAGYRTWRRRTATRP